MDKSFKVTEIETGFHPEGYRIDKTASPMDRYTKWEILPGDKWQNPKPVCFESMPDSGWFKKDKFDWNNTSDTKE
jgi:hypothetical protein